MYINNLVIISKIIVIYLKFKRGFFAFKDNMPCNRSNDVASFLGHWNQS